MGDAGEGLVDAQARIQERLEEIALERLKARAIEVKAPEQVRALESLRLARTELGRQLAATSHEQRRTQILQAIEEVDRRITAVTTPGPGTATPARKNA